MDKPKTTVFDQLDKITFDQLIRKLKGSVYEIFVSEMRKLLQLEDQRYQMLMNKLTDLEKRFNAPSGDFHLLYMTLDELAYRSGLARRKVMTLTTEGDSKLMPVSTSPAWLFPRMEAEEWLAERRRYKKSR